jgi:glycerol-3-phosphate dehydrogenase (NAD(P)+)
VAEGAFTAPVLADLAAARGIAMPIVAAVDAILKGAEARKVVADLLSRPLKAEREAGA